MDEEGNTVLHYAWNNIDCSEEEYYKAIEDFIMSRVGDVEWKAGSIFDDEEGYINVLSAYDALRTTTYIAFSPEILEFDLSDGILTVSIDDGSRFGWDGGEREYFSFSYPISDDCSWESGYYADDFVHDEYMDYNTVKECIESEQAQYKEGKEKYGDDFSVESPPGFDFIVVDGVIVKVYMLLP